MSKRSPKSISEKLEIVLLHLEAGKSLSWLARRYGEMCIRDSQQGAGIIDTAAAISTGLYLTGEDGYGSITLGNVEDTFSFTVTLHNITNEDKTLNYSTQLTTDTAQNGLITLAPRLLAEIPGGKVTVKANSSTTVTINVDASSFAEELKMCIRDR